jgi:hypothetical protein
LATNPDTITEDEFASLKSPEDEAFISQYTKRIIVPNPDEFIAKGLDPPKMWVRNPPPGPVQDLPPTAEDAAAAAAAEAELREELGSEAVGQLFAPAERRESTATSLSTGVTELGSERSAPLDAVNPGSSSSVAPLSGEQEDVSSRRESVFSGPAASESSRPSSATSLGTVGVPQLRDQDFMVRLGAARKQFEQMRAATGKLEMTVNASKVVRKPTKRRNQTQRITPADIDNLYMELKASQLTRKAKTNIERNKRAQRRLTARVAPAPVDDELAAIEADLKAAEETVGQFKAMVDELRAKDRGVPEVAEWIMTADMELELQLDYLSQVEQNLAAVPGPVDLTRLRQVHAGLDLPRPPASLTKPPWRNGGRRKTPRRKLRNSTFRRHRKH